MKKIIFGLMFILLASFGSAGSIEDLNYNDKVCPFGVCDTNRQVDDYNVNIHADTADYANRANYSTYSNRAWRLGGWTVDDINNRSDRRDRDILTYIEEKPDGSGVNIHALANYLYGHQLFFDDYDTYTDFVYETFATRVDVENAHLRMDGLEARIYMLENNINRTNNAYDKIMTQIRAQRIGTPQFTSSGFKVFPSGHWKDTNGDLEAVKIVAK